MLALAAALLVSLAIARPVIHGPLGASAFVLALALDREVARRIGAPRRWLATAVVLVAIGLWLGPRSAPLGPIAISREGALAATTMVSRAIGIVLLGAAFGALVPAERALGRLRGTRLRRFAEVLVIAMDLLPSLLATLEGARADILAREPGLRRAPRRAFELLVLVIVHASTLADSVASRLSRGDSRGTST
jgi:hypothetical protein